MTTTENREPLRATVRLVEFDDGPGLRIDVIIPWERLSGLARSIRYWRIRLEKTRSED